MMVAAIVMVHGADAARAAAMDTVAPVLIFAVWLTLVISSLVQAAKKRAAQVRAAAADEAARAQPPQRTQAGGAVRSAGRDVKAAVEQVLAQRLGEDDRARQAVAGGLAAFAGKMEGVAARLPSGAHLPAAAVGQALGAKSAAGLKAATGSREEQRPAGHPPLSVGRVLSRARDLPALMVAHAVLGPCAANRGLGHEPGEW